MAAEQVKAGRITGLLHWHFRQVNADGVLLRRRELGLGAAGHSWYCLPPFTKDVFDLCSGAHSCREIAALLAPDRARPTVEVVRRVVRSVRTLVGIGVIEWVDDAALRAARRGGFVVPDPAGILPADRKGDAHAHH